MRIATVVLPVPGLPVKHMCSDGGVDCKPFARRSLSISSSAAMSRMRPLTGASPTSSASSWSSTDLTPEASNSAFAVVAPSQWAGAETSMGSICGRNVATSISRAFGALLHRIAFDAVAHRAPGLFRADEPEAGFVRRPVDDEGQNHRLGAVRRIEGTEPDVMAGERLAAALQLEHHAGCVRYVEHRIAEHLPVDIAGMRIVRVLEPNSPPPGEAEVHLPDDLRVAQVRQERKGPLGDSHGVRSGSGNRRRRNEIRSVGRGVVEGDLAPGVERRLEWGAPSGGVTKNLEALVPDVAALVSRQHHAFEGHPVGRGTGLDALRVADRPAAELQHDVVSEQMEKLMHLPGMDAAGCHRHHLLQGAPVLVEEDGAGKIDDGGGVVGAVVGG